MSLTLTLVLLVLTALEPNSAQDTLAQNSCAFRDGPVVYNIELFKGLVEQPCPTEALADQVRDAERRTLELTQQVAQAQSATIRAIEASANLTAEVSRLRQELHVTQEAMRLSQAAASDCPPLYDVRNDDFKSCYMFVGRDLSWYDAETFCMSTGGHLVGLETEEEQTFVINYIRSSRVLPGKHMWTGGNDIAKEDHWVWAGINEPFNFTAWLLYPHKDEGPIQMPDNHLELEHCVHLFHLHNYEWNDIYCGYEYFFICEYKLI